MPYLPKPVCDWDASRKKSLQIFMLWDRVVLYFLPTSDRRRHIKIRHNWTCCQRWGLAKYAQFRLFDWYLNNHRLESDWKINKQLATSIYRRNSNSTHFPKTPFCVINGAKGSFYVLLHLLLSFSMVHVANSSWPCVNEHGFFRHGLLDRVEEAPLSWYTVEYTNAF